MSPLYVSLPGSTWPCGLKKTALELQRNQEHELFLIIENNIRGGVSSVMGDRLFKSSAEFKGLYIDANNLLEKAMSQPLPYKDLRMNSLVTLIEIPETDDYAETGYFVNFDLNNSIP